MDSNQIEASFAGDPRHSGHERWLLELGRAHFEATKVAGIAFDILRVLHGVESVEMYNEPLGRLLERLRGLLKKNSDLPHLQSFVSSLELSHELRNDLVHSLPVLHGLHRRTSKDLYRVVNFYTVEDLKEATNMLNATLRIGSTVLYADDGAAIAAWYEKQNSASSSA